MVLSNLQQSAVFLWSLLFGAGLGLFYDLFRWFRLFVRCSTVSVFFQDLAYFLTAAVASFLFIFEVNDGTVRLFILAAFLAGGVSFRLTVGQLLFRVCLRIKKYFSGRKRPKTHKKHKKNSKAEG